MTESVYSLPDMKEAHLGWEDDHRRWREEISVWQRQHETALEDVRRIRDLIHEHGIALTTIEGKICDHEMAMEEHGRRVEAFEQGREGADLPDDLVGPHREQAKRHRIQAEAQDRLRAHHDAVKQQVADLLAALRAAV